MTNAFAANNRSMHAAVLVTEREGTKEAVLKSFLTFSSLEFLKTM